MSGEVQMLRTIQIGSCVSVQGLVVGHLDDGRVVIKVDDRTFAGVPIARPMPRVA